MNVIHVFIGLTVLVSLSLSQRTRKYGRVGWVDGNLTTAFEPFFDRMVFILIDKPFEHDGMKKEDIIIANGVFFTKNLVITSFNPFRHLIKDKLVKNLVTVLAIKDRKIFDGVVRDYLKNEFPIMCARPVIPLGDDETIWHGEDENDKEHSPVHDLLVIRVKPDVVFFSPENHDYAKVKDITAQVPVGPVMSILAQRKHRLGYPMGFASTGFISHRLMRVARRLKHTYYYKSDKVIADCDEWLPREWGYFICIKNIHDYPGLGSAMLFHDEKLFGVGCFHLRRGNESILVFTDVRYYYNLIHQTCTSNDQELIS